MNNNAGVRSNKLAVPTVLQVSAMRCLIVHILASKVLWIKRCFDDRRVEDPFSSYNGIADLLRDSDSHSFSFKIRKLVTHAHRIFNWAPQFALSLSPKHRQPCVVWPPFEFTPGYHHNHCPWWLVPAPHHPHDRRLASELCSLRSLSLFPFHCYCFVPA